MIDEARGRTTIHRELAEIDGLSLDELMARGSAPYRVFAKLDRKMDELLGETDLEEKNHCRHHRSVTFHHERSATGEIGPRANNRG